MLSLAYAVMIFVCIAPSWLFLKRLNLTSWWLAAVIGFFAPLGLWMVTNADSYLSGWHVLLSGLPYALCGSAAGFAAWVGGGRAARDGN